ncbi:MAG: leucine-rich repeat domain-containing protein [Proteobacteria bacterium]|nr:leucine-rich repeat domain-containing protein [Pseudomonadota bacterium]
MTEKNSPFSSFLKNLGNPDLIKTLGDAASKALSSATKVIEDAATALDAAAEKFNEKPASPASSQQPPQKTEQRTKNIKQHTGMPIDGPYPVLPEKAKDLKWSDMTLENGIHIREFLWHEPEVYESAYASREGRPDSGGHMLALYITDYKEPEARAGQTELVYKYYNRHNFEIDQCSLEICQDAFANDKNLSKIHIEGPVTRVGKHAFANLPNLKSISIETRAYMHIDIGDCAFQNCTSLESVDIDNIHSLGNKCFYNCQKIQKLKLSDTCQSIGHKCFSGCAALYAIKLPRVLKRLEEKTFYHSGIRDIVWPKSLLYIGESCFKNCNQLRAAMLPECCQTIDKCCFMGCENLKTVHLPLKLRVISDKALANCRSLERIDWPDYQYIDGCLYPQIGTHILTGCFPSPTSDLSIPGKISEPETMFAFVDGAMRRVQRTPEAKGNDFILPPLPPELQQYAKENAPSAAAQQPSDLSNIVTPAIKAISGVFQSLKENISQTSIFNDALSSSSNNSALNSQYAYTGTKLIKYKGKEKQIHIPDFFTDISEFAFENNTHIEEIIIPNSVDHIGRGAFRNCTALKHVKLPVNEYWVILEAEMFKGCRSLTTIDWSPYLKHVRRDAIEGCPLSIKTINHLHSHLVFSSKRNAYVLPQIAKTDKYRSGNSSEPRPEQPEDVEFFDLGPDGTSASKADSKQNSDRSGYKKLLDAVVSAYKAANEGIHETLKQVQEIPKKVECDIIFEGDVMQGIAKTDPMPEPFIVPEFIHEIEASAFNLGTEIETLIFKGSIRQIAANNCVGLTKLKTVIFEDDVENIEANAFKGCSALSRVEFHKGLGALWDSCFANCTALEAIDLPDNCTLIDKNCFSGCIRLKHVHLPAQVKTIKRNAFAYCISLETIDWPEPFVIDKHKYPKIEPLSFAQTLSSGDNWERFELKNGVYKRVLVQAISEDPNGVFDMMLPGEANMYRRTPQLLMNAVLNATWEISSGDELRYEYQMTLLKTCLEFARIFTAIYEDDRAERLNVIYYLRDTLFSHPEYTTKDIAGALPYALNDTLFAICGKGSIRKYNDECIIEMASPYLGIDLPRDKSKAEPSAAQKQIINNMYNELHIGTHQPFRYDPWHTELTAIFNKEDADFYTFSNYISQLAYSIFQRYLRIEEDLSGDTNINAWCQAWNKFLHDNYSADFHIVLFQTNEFENTLSHSLELYYVSILTWPQIHAIRDLLKPFHLEDIMTVFTMEMHFSETSE